MTVSFQPKMGEIVSINGREYVWAENPDQPGMIMRKEGTESFLYALRAAEERDDSRIALKVFLRHYRTPSIVAQVERLRAVMDIQGLQAANRIVLIPQIHMDLLTVYRDLMYAVVMPWIDGPTWQDIVKEKQAISRQQAWTMAKSLAETLATLEQHGMAHGRLTAANLLLPCLHPQAEEKVYPIELVDLEHAYHPDWKAQDGIRDEQWGPYADRLSGALLLVEMLGWMDPQIRQIARARGYFFPQELHRDGERYRKLLACLRKNWGDPLAQLFERAWAARSVEQCPQMGEWLITLCEAKSLAAFEPPAQIAVERTSEPLPHAYEIRKLLMIEPAALSLRPGEAKELKAFVIWVDGREEEVSDRVLWHAEGADSIVHTDQGIIHGLAPGTVKVWAEYEGQQAEIFVCVSSQESMKLPERKPLWKERKMWAGAAVAAGILLAGTLAFSMLGEEEQASSNVAADVQKSGQGKTQSDQEAEKQKPADATKQGAPATENGTLPSTVVTTPPVPAVPPVSGNTAVTPVNSGQMTAPPTAKAPAAIPAQSKPAVSAAPAPTKSVAQPKKSVSKPKTTTRKKPVKQSKPPVKSAAAPVVRLAPKEQAGKWGYIRKGTGFEKDKVVIPFQYDHATPFSGGLALVKKEGKFGYIDANGKQVIPFQFDYATPFANGRATVKKDGKLGQINQTGAMIK